MAGKLLAPFFANLSFFSLRGAINPARDFGPRLFATIFYPGDETLWDGFFTVPLFGPLIGGAIGALTYQLSIAAHWPYNAAPSKDRDDVSL